MASTKNPDHIAEYREEIMQELLHLKCSPKHAAQACLSAAALLAWQTNISDDSFGMETYSPSTPPNIAMISSIVFMA